MSVTEKKDEDDPWAVFDKPLFDKPLEVIHGGKYGDRPLIGGS